MAFFLSKQNTEEKQLGIYIHVPFCRSKCQYCDFYSLGGVLHKDVIDRYMQALADHIKETGQLAPGYEVDTIYFGGGTPSFFGAENLEKILDELHRNFHLSVEAEITLEANPDSIHPQMLRKLLRSGFNRISIGVQSDDDEMLKKLGRPHNFHQAKLAMQQARKAGFGNISLDLMYGLPDQTLEAWKNTVTNIVAMRPDHLSCYALKIEENTPMWGYQANLNLPSDDLQADMYLAACEILEEYGYQHYEISNWAKKGRASRHNLKYWSGGEYIGFGPAASSDFAGKRFTIVRDLDAYVKGMSEKGTVLSECEEIPMRERAGEYIMLGLRTSVGIHAEEYERNYLMPFADLEQKLERLAGQGLAVKERERWRLTEKGWLVSNQIILALQDAQERSTPLTKRR